MTVVDPIAEAPYGKADWQNYISNWRREDAEYLQERSILRYATDVARRADWSTPQAGQVTYRNDVDRLEMYSSLRSSWVSLMLFQYLTSTDTSTGVTLSHTAASGGGVVLRPASVTVTLPFTVSAGALTTVLVADGTGVKIKTGTKTALLYTDTANLVSDTPLTVPAVSVAGAFTAATGNITILTATSATITNINVSGTLGGSGVLNGASGTIGGVVLSGSKVNAPSGITSLDGLRSSNGHLYGDVDGAVIRYNNLLGPFLHIGLNGGAWDNMQGDGSIPTDGAFEFNSTVRTKGSNVFQSFGKNVAPSFYSASDPGWWNYPDGTIWVN